VTNSQKTLPAAELLDSVTASVLEQIDKGQPTPIVLIDGRSGSGKTSFAKSLQNQLFVAGESSPRVIHMDDLYNGWHGLQAGSDYLARLILGIIKSGKTASWQEFDWAAGNRSGAWREFEGGTPLIIEGCGSLSAASAEFAHLTIWLETDAAVRKQRWDAREPEAHSNFWPIWAAQEEEFYAREKSATIADFVGLTSSVAWDSATLG
jgi:energy-coupling factor transporter ATP-binding protein EcfA2